MIGRAVPKKISSLDEVPWDDSTFDGASKDAMEWDRSNNGLITATKGFNFFNFFSFVEALLIFYCGYKHVEVPWRCEVPLNCIYFLQAFLAWQELRIVVEAHMLEAEKMRAEYRSVEAHHASVSIYLMFRDNENTLLKASCFMTRKYYRSIYIYTIISDV